MIEKFKTLFFVKSSLISLYLALTIPLPFISIEKLKIPSIITFVLGLYLIITITSDYVETSDNKISYKTSFVSKIFGKKNWEISWKDIKIIKNILNHISIPEKQITVKHIIKITELISLQGTKYYDLPNKVKFTKEYNMASFKYSGCKN